MSDTQNKMMSALDEEIRVLEHGRLLLATADAEMLQRAVEVLGSERGAALWLIGKPRALGRRIPLEVASSSAGADEVRQVLGAYENGGYL